MVKRKKYYVVYLKEGSMIVDILNVMEAYVGLMDMENVRILKDMRNDINRRVNCETANLGKAVDAAQEQLSAIRKLEETGQYNDLPDKLRKTAELRKANPEATLQELALMQDPPLTKSAINHRMRKIIELSKG